MSGELANIAWVLALSAVVGALAGVAAFVALRAAIIRRVREDLARGTPRGFCREKLGGLPVPVYCRPSRDFFWTTERKVIAVIYALFFSAAIAWCLS